MKLATFIREDHLQRVGVVMDEGIVDLTDIAPQLPQTMLALVSAERATLEAVNQAAERAVRTPLAEVRLLAPIPRPPEYLGVGLNYRDHAREARLSLPEVPMIFNKQTSCIVGPNDDVLLPRLSDRLDYEGELGLVIGRAGRDLSAESAAAAIFGFVVVNDLSVRDTQFSSPTVTLGKSFDTHGPYGPWITTADEVLDPQNLTIVTAVNGEIRQSGTTADMLFDCRHIVSFLSEYMSLQLGTVVTTGTPAGVGLCRQPPAYLRQGDVVTVAISGLGRLVNRVVAENTGNPR